MAPWDVYRIPVDCALIRRKDASHDQTEHARFRQRLQACRRPAWCQQVVVTADAAYTSRAHRALIQTLGHWYVMALPRTWKCADGKAVKALGTHLPRGKSTQMRIPPVTTQRRRTCWGYAKRAQRRHWGDVTVVRSQCRRHDGPRQTNILVTDLPGTVTARELVGVSLRRWWIELLMKARKGVVGLGQPQVTSQADRVARSATSAIMAYVLLLKLRVKDIPTDRPWSAFRRQRAFAWEVVQAQSERSARPMARKWLQMRKAA
jgi:Transposase DDE domain